MTVKPVGFRAEGILGGKTYEIEFGSDATIILGPNGTGKSTLLSLYYYALTKQWKQLSEMEFKSITILLPEDKITITNESLIFEPPDLRLPVRYQRIMNVLMSNKQIVNITKGGTLSAKQFHQLISSLPAGLNVDRNDIDNIQRILRSQPNLFNRATFEVEDKIRNLDSGTVLFLPTYRRIEKDIAKIFPDLEERFRDRADKRMNDRSNLNFIEIVNFGMRDIVQIIREYTSKIAIQSRSRSDTATQEYIRDLVRGSIDQYSVSLLKEADQITIDAFLKDLNVSLLTREDKNSLEASINAIRHKGRGKPAKKDQFLAYFVEKLLIIFKDTQKLEAPIHNFVRIVRKYIDKSKDIRYELSRIVISDTNTGNEIPFESLSSGEKQIFSIFAYLLLGENGPYTVLIDEPELSLSVPWQRQFLPDIIDTGQCAQLFAVSHSPFVFDNSLRKCVTDVRRLER